MKQQSDEEQFRQWLREFFNDADHGEMTEIRAHTRWGIGNGAIGIASMAGLIDKEETRKLHMMNEADRDSSLNAIRVLSKEDKADLVEVERIKDESAGELET